MAFNYSRLTGKIVEVFGTQLRFAEAMELSERTISLKLNSKIEWKQGEIIKACRLLSIDSTQIPSYFFTAYVQYRTLRGGSTMTKGKYINTDRPVRLRRLIVSGDIDDNTKIAIYDADGRFVCRGAWYEDRVLNYSTLEGTATKAETANSIAFRLKGGKDSA